MTRPWHKFPTPIALIKLLRFRNKLREENLHNTAQLPTKNDVESPLPLPGDRHLVVRTADGSFNDLEDPKMGMAGTRFGRNVPLKNVYPNQENLLNPNPRIISRKLLTREKFVPATTLNLLAAAWIQFQTHDWFSHGDNQQEHKFEIPLEEGDPWPEEYRPLEVKKTLTDTTRGDENTQGPPTYINKVTHWWDASQIYGSDQETIDKLRSHVDGKMLIEDNGLLPINPENGIDLVGFDDNWWIGLSMLHTIFVKEHNTICDHLKQKYLKWTDEDIFDRARLINAALLAKIHTVEWTPGILGHPALKIAMDANWWGLLGEHTKRLFGRLGDSELLSGIIGSPTDHHTAPYYLTEEFVSVYRMHPLMPDEFEFYSVKNGNFLQKNNLFEVAGNRTRSLVENLEMSDLFYSFGITHPGAITLYNYPSFLQQLVRDNGEVFDLAAVDILRDRERGVPRYNDFRELIGRGRVKSFEEITDNEKWVKELREVYQNNIDSVDLMVGMFAENPPEGFGFSDTAFRVFILMASRRLKSDRFFTEDYRAEIYTQFGLDWIDDNNMLTVLRRHYPSLNPALFSVGNAFAPWRKIGL